MLLREYLSGCRLYKMLEAKDTIWIVPYFILSQSWYLYIVVERDYDTYSGIILEKYFRQLFAESNEYSDILGYWDNKGENEIDLIAVNYM